MKTAPRSSRSRPIDAAILLIGFIGTTLTVLHHYNFITFTAEVATTGALIMTTVNLTDYLHWRDGRDYWHAEYIKAWEELEEWQDETVLNRFATYYHRAAPDEWPEIAPHIIAARLDLPGWAYGAFMHALDDSGDLVSLRPSILATNWQGEEETIESLLAPLIAYDGLAGTS